VLVILLAVLFAIIDFGRALYTYHFVSNVAREATRWASVRSDNSQAPNAPANSGNIKTTFGSSSALAGMALDPTKLTFDVTHPAIGTGPAACRVAGNNKAGCLVQVHVTYSYRFMVPFLPASAFDMNSTSRMVISQ